MRGRKPKPSAVKRLNGNPGRRPINKKEPKPAAGAPQCPDHLDAAARTEWARMSVILTESGLLTKLDGTALAAFCVVYARWAAAESAVQRSGIVIKSPQGFPIVSPFLSVANKAMADMRHFLTEFGMTPASRSRLQVAETDPGDELADFNKKRS